MSKDNVQKIRALQALSTFFVGEQPTTPGATYPWVSIRSLAHFLDVDPTYLKISLEPLAAQGFCELAKYEARLTPSRWALNTSRYASYLSFYVANAPATLRGEYSQLPVDPRRLYNYQPQLEGNNATIASNFNGVYSSSQHRENCEPSPDQGPFEIIPLYHHLSCPELSPADNLAFLTSYCSILFRAFLSALWLQGTQVSTAYGQVQLLLAEYIHETPCLVAAPCDGIWLGFQTQTPQWDPRSFLAPLAGQSLEFMSASNFPRILTNLNGGTITLNFNGTATIVASDKVGAPSLQVFFQVVGACLGGSFIVSLVPVGQTQILPQLATPGCPPACF